MWRKKQLIELTHQKLNLYIKSNNVTRDIISDLIRLIRHLPHQSIKAHITSHLKTMQCVKWLILLHNLNFAQIKNKESEIHSLLQLINPTSISNSSFDNILFQKMVKPYKAYLLKRNTFSLREIDQQFHCYALVNMLKVGLSFTNILFTLGRYLFKKYNFLIQFNVIMAKDLSYLYKSLKYKMDQEFQAENVQAIELINEGMYSVYYNCYFNRYVSHIAPEWINVEMLQTKSTIQLLTSTKICSLRQVKTQKEINSNRLQVQPEHQVSIAIEQSSLHLKDQFKSISTLASHRQIQFSDAEESTRRQKQNRERREFIYMAESILQSFTENQEDAN